MRRIFVIFVGSLLITALSATLSGPASANNDSHRTEPAAIVVALDATGAPVAMCMMPGDSIELRAGIGAAIGFFAGLPIFIVGAIPGALIGAGFGALSYVIAKWSADSIPGPC